MALAPVKNRTKSNNTPKQRALRQLRMTVIIFVVLLVLAIGAGLFYVWLMGLQAKPSAVTTAPQTNQPSFLTPHKVPDNVAIGSSIQSISSPVSPGDNASLTVRTTESAVCTVKIIRLDSSQKEVARVTDSGLSDKKADEFGMVVWTWTMPSDAAIAKWTADIFCTRGDKSTHSVGEVIVQKHA